MIGIAVILSLSAVASLRETAAIKGLEEFFARRRDGTVGVTRPSLRRLMSWLV